jgi:hypothetical protein
VHRLKVGGYVYVSSVDSTEIVLLAFTFVVGLIVSIIVVPKEGFELPTVTHGESKWMTYLNWGADSDPLGMSRPMKRFFLLIGLVYAGFLYLFGSQLARFAVSHGLNLGLGQ